jgi:FMNH2-dependent dimethyl sulfone monooxygenase
LLDEIINGANTSALAKFAESVKEAGKSSKEGQGMWATAQVKDLVQYNEGFRTGLIGTKEQVARRIVKLKSLGADLVLVRRDTYSHVPADTGRLPSCTFRKT